MIRIRPGRSWRLNPAYLADLREDSSKGADILDVVGIEVDGVDIAAGVGEARVISAVDELSQAVLQIGEGEPAAQATVGPGPTELVIEARGHDLLLSLVSLAPQARMVASGLLVDAKSMRHAVLHAARSLLLDLLGVSAAMGDAPVAQRLGHACAQLARRPQKAPRAWPPAERSAKAMVAAGPRAKKRGESLRVQLPPETLARLRGGAGVKLAPLAAHLGQGSISLVREGAPGLHCEGPIFLMLRNLLSDAEALVEAHESGGEAFTLPFGPHSLSWDLAAGTVRAPGWRRPLQMSPLRMAALVSLAARAYAAEALKAHRGDELAADLREAASTLDRHCADLESGDLRRAQDLVAAPTPAAPRGTQAPLARGRMRRLVYRQAWSARADGARRVLLPAPGVLLVERAGQLSAHDAATGASLWQVPAAPGAVTRGNDLFYAEPPGSGDALVRLDLATGEVRWKRRMRGAAHPARLWPLPAGVLRELPGEGLALVKDGGTLGFRARLAGLESASLVAGLLVASLKGGIAGIDRSDGAVLWKRKLRPAALVVSGARALVLSRGALQCIDPASGEPAWEQEVPGDARALVAAEGAAWLLGGGAVLSFALPDGAAKPPASLPWARALAAEEDGPVVATGDEGVARLDGRRWTQPDFRSGAPALLQRGVVGV
ncbi:MAG TPA: PQQ-binding-like beta-propeller repeat protein, partial [Myxococcales bacterium]|nr:PQQ-binding-like beta-propeller repeat protein [Myxococcales bacterium]